MKIAALAHAAGVAVETVRYYQRIELVDVPSRDGAFRTYGDEHLQRLRFIRRAQALGFTLHEVRALIALSEADCENVEQMARERLGAVAERIADLRRIEAVLQDVVERCSSRGDYAGCPIIETLSAP